MTRDPRRPLPDLLFLNVLEDLVVHGKVQRRHLRPRLVEVEREVASLVDLESLDVVLVDLEPVHEVALVLDLVGDHVQVVLK